MIADPHRTNAPGVRVPKCPVAVTDQVSRRFVPGKRFCDLPRDPLGGRIRGDAYPGQLSAAMLEDHQSIEQLERDIRTMNKSIEAIPAE